MILHSTNDGSGEPVVLIHGLFGSLENLGALARDLKQDFSVHALDLPNHGRSPHSENADLSAMKDAVLAWMDAKNLHKVAVVGHSLGGKVAMELALCHPERVAALVVMDIAPVAYDPHHNNIFAALAGLDLGAFGARKDIDNALRDAIPEAGVRSFLLKNLTRLAAGGFGWKMNLAGLQNDYAQLIRENTAQGVYHGATLFLKGGKSDYLKPSQQAATMSRFPKAEFKIVADTGHWLHAEKPSLVASLIKKFLQQASH